MNKLAYEYGAQLALVNAGLLKSAAPISSFLSNPYVARAAIGAGLGGLVGAGTDIGTGRGALAGSLAGVGSVYGSRLGGKMLGKRLAGEMRAARAATPSTVSSAASTRNTMLGDIAERYGLGTPQWKKNLTMARGAGGLGLGALAGGAALMATQPPKPKHFWE